MEWGAPHPLGHHNRVGTLIELNFTHPESGDFPMRSRRVARAELTLMVAVCVLLACLTAAKAQPDDNSAAAPLPRAHAHNDYEHERPLQDALALGFTSVEADVHWVDGELLVAHDLADARPERTIEKLYLDPLAERVHRHDGKVHAAPAEFVLLVDLKTEAEATYQALDERLAKYPDLLTRWTGERRIPGPVTVIVSGNRPIDTIAAQGERRAGVDGRLMDLERPANVELMPLLSDRWGAHFSWNGRGTFPAAEREKLQAIVRRTHERGQKLRFWGTPDTPEAWRELRTAEVDFINTDDLRGLATFLRSP